MKYCIKKYPKGSFPNQQTDGRYIDRTLYENLKVIAKTIVRDQTFLGVCASSTLEVGTGKSVFMQQIGECYTELVNDLHGLNISFTEKNIVFRPKDLIETSFNLPKHSCIILDEWEDAHYWSELGMTLRQFFRKCRQLNLFILIIIPNFFQLNIGYAISRSVFLIDVRFEGEFDRGYFRFYNFDRKKDLYIRGKKTYNYNTASPNFSGRFADGYVVGKEAYLKKKHDDLLRYEDKSDEKPNAKQIKSIKSELFYQLYYKLKEVGIERLADAFGVSGRTGDRWLKEHRDTNKEGVTFDKDAPTTIMNNLNIKDDYDGDGEDRERDDGSINRSDEG
jgi:hypothetical protein